MCRTVRFLNQAAEEAERSQLDIKHGALLVRNGKVIGSGHNSSRTRLSAVPGAFPGVSMHSEVRLISPANRLPEHSPQTSARAFTGRGVTLRRSVCFMRLNGSER